MRWNIPLMPALMLAVATGVAQADTFYLLSGGQLEGKLLNPDQSPRATYEVLIERGGTLVLPESLVDRVVVQSDLERRYEAALRKMPDTAAAHWEMADRCQRAGLAEAREFHLRQVLRHDADHEAARHALGYSRVDGRWVRQDQWMEEKGYVRFRGSWRLPQELELIKLAEEREEQIVEWRKNLKTWRSWIVKGRDNHAAGEREIRAIRSPLAVPALADLLQNEKEHRALKLLYVDVLGQIGSGDALAVLARHVLYDADGKIRDAALEQVVRSKSPAVVAAFSDALQDDNNHVVHRAAVALGRMQDTRATLPLIDALITEHKEIVGGGGGIRPVFSNQGGGLNVGGKPKVEKVKKQNEPVLHALTSLHTGVNFGYNQAAWKAWYISNHAPPPLDLRRER